ncbi:granzyme B-like [Trichosurus vulpecula]|uniref:granzyme B-like n=1 Tax=Trichosurus vulpecula TaxID=9337 RepID=UPI00186AF65B|nr:granzyme B-like [Trichosurus vulpecula]
MYFLFPLLLAFLQAAVTRAGEIIGGWEAKPHSRPYMANLKYWDENGTEYRCGAFLVREDFLLTAAHCWGSKMSILLGAHNIQKPEKTQQCIPVLKAIPHQLYNRWTFKNDIMLVKLAKKAKLNRAVNLLALPQKKDKVRPGKRCLVAGWGSTTTPEKNYPDTLQEVELKVRKERECMDKYGSKYYGSTQMCAGDPGDKKASFRGDSGGPLVCDRVAQGIVSFGRSNGKNPPVYTRISSFLPWIKKTMNSHEY